jgi:MazG family protein
VAAAESSRALTELDALTRRLRRECPWDREQDERSIVPHTVEEAYELADAAERGDDAKLLDELGDVLFQVMFLSLLLEERGAGDLAQVAEHCRQKLIRRHPHVFGDAEVADAAEVLRNWDAIKATEPGRERGVFGEVPENLPALLYARKLQRRAASAGLHGGAGTQPADASSDVESAGDRAQDASPGDRECFRDIGERLFALVDEARVAKVDPELALRAAADRFREQIENGER